VDEWFPAVWECSTSQVGYSQASSGTLGIDLGGSATCSAVDRPQIDGRAALSGTLNIVRMDGCKPSPGQRFTILTFASRSGDFGQVQGLGDDLRREDTETSITLVAR
jgi:hypothetical protein